MIELTVEDYGASVGTEFAVTRALFRKRKALVEQARDRYSVKNAATGRCLDCPRPARAGRRRCERCGERDKARMRARRASRKIAPANLDAALVSQESLKDG